MRHQFTKRETKFGIGNKQDRTRLTPWGEYAFDSVKEAMRFDQLVLLQKAGEILTFVPQVGFPLGGTRYRCDFMIFWSNQTVTFEDVKGYATNAYKAKKRRVEELYRPITIAEL